MQLIPYLNVGAGILVGVYILYVSSLWVLVFFNKKKIIANFCSEDGYYSLSIINVILLFSLVVDLYSYEGMYKISIITAILLFAITVFSLFLCIGLLLIFIEYIRDKFIDT